MRLVAARPPDAQFSERRDYKTYQVQLVEDATLVGFNDFNDQLDDARGREELAALLPFRHGELAEEVFLYFPECIAFAVHRHGGEVLQQGDDQVLVKTVVRPWQNVFQILVVRFNGPHRIVDGLADVGTFRQVQQVREPGGLWQEEDSLRLVISFADGAASAALLANFSLALANLRWRSTGSTSRARRG